MIPTEIEKKHVYDVYDKIAPHFSHTRYKPWPKVAEYLNNLEKGCMNADIGILSIKIRMWKWEIFGSKFGEYIEYWYR